jgi:hypothetical protein
MTKYDIATQGKSTMSSRYQAALMTHVMPTTLQATDWETFLVRIGIVKLLTIIIEILAPGLTKLIARDKDVSTF